MRDWIKATPHDEIAPEKTYFIAQKPGCMGSTLFWCRYLSGKEQWSSKPGIAIRFVGDAAFVKKLSEYNGQLVAIEVPSDADKRWRARKPVLFQRKRK